MSERLALTAIILTRDEAANIGECIACLSRVDDVVVLDSGSTDGTVVAARSARPDVRVFERAFTDFGDQRNWALDNTAPKHDWILFVDADEFCDDPFLDEVANFLAEPGKAVGGFVAGRNYFLGRWLKHSTMYPSYQLRLLKQGHVRFRKQGHGQREVTDGPLHHFKAGWRHEAISKGISQWIARHNVYSTEEAKVLVAARTQAVDWSGLVSRDPVGRRRSLKSIFLRMPGRPFLAFVYLYVFRLGFLDGYPGFLFCLMLFSQQVFIVAKAVEHETMDAHEDRVE